MTMTPEERAASTAAKQAKRAANREAWRNSPLNANNLHKLTQEAAAPVMPEIAEPTDKGSASLAKMRSIMADPATPLYRRLDAAEVVLSYELGAGAAVGVEPEQIAAGRFAS